MTAPAAAALACLATRASRPADLNLRNAERDASSRALSSSGAALLTIAIAK